jgi:hypothetical protein
MEKRKNANKILTGNSEKKRPLGRPISREKIKMELGERCEHVIYIHLS